MNFKGQWVNTPSPSPEENSGEVLVESTGYMPAQRRIEDMLNAGVRLQAARAEMFDYPEGTVDDGVSMDITRTPGFDLADAGRLARETDHRLAEQALADKKAKKDAEEAVKAENEALKKEASKLREDAEAFRRRAERAPNENS